MEKMKKYDLHVHSKYSLDCLNEPKDIVKRYKELGFNGFSITDHGSNKGYKKAKEYINEKKIEIEIIGGCEYKTEKGEVIGLFIEEIISSKSFFDICDNVHEQGGFVIIPHPFDKSKKAALDPNLLTIEELKQIDCIESFNASCLNMEYNKKAEEFAQKFNFTKTAGSDAHLLAACGKAATLIEEEYDLDIAIRKRKTFIEGNLSPFYYRGIPSLIKFLKKRNLIKIDEI
ncbi:MAG: PHP domain-containing protein [Candidatus Anstonellaceae archaeon]